MTSFNGIIKEAKLYNSLQLLEAKKIIPLLCEIGYYYDTICKV